MVFKTKEQNMTQHPSRTTKSTKVLYVFMEKNSNQLFQVLMEEDEYVGFPTPLNFQKV